MHQVTICSAALLLLLSLLPLFSAASPSAMLESGENGDELRLQRRMTNFKRWKPQRFGKRNFDSDARELWSPGWLVEREREREREGRRERRRRRRERREREGGKKEEKSEKRRERER